MIKTLIIIFSNIYFLFGQTNWQTAIYSNDIWKYYLPSIEISQDWNLIEFNDSHWNEGIGGFGYSDDDDETIINNTLSVYLRKKFKIENVEDISTGILSADYDDGFVAYINGYEIARSQNLGEENSFVPFDMTTSNDHEAKMQDGGEPETFLIDSLFLKEILLNGENILAIQVHNVGESSSDLSSNFFLSFKMLNFSDSFRNVPEWFRPPISYSESNLPIIRINTFGEIIPDEPRIPAHMGIINNINGINKINDNFNDYDGPITIELRGNTSQSQPKKPYRFETVDNNGENNNVSLLGMPSENDWVLYAPWSDKSLIRNVLTYKLSQEMGRYSARSKFCELWLNGEYQGIYVLMEKIKRDKNRINISKLEENEITGDDLTGGYILKFDWAWTGDNLGGFESRFGTLYNYHYPKPSDIVQEQETYIQNYIDDFEQIMSSDLSLNEEIGYQNILDVNSFIDLIILQELSKNVDAYRLSTYVYKEKESLGNKLFAGPIWDLNHGYGNCDYGETWITSGWLLEINTSGWDDPIAFWWQKLWEDDNFQKQFSQRYTDLRYTVLSEKNIFSKIDSMSNYLDDAIERNYNKWPNLGEYLWPNYYVFDTYEEEIVYLKSWIKGRLNWMDSESRLSLNDKLILPNSFEIKSIYPNPFNSNLNIEFETLEKIELGIDVYDISGNKIVSLLNKQFINGKNKLVWNAKNDLNEKVAGGIYFINFVSNDMQKSQKIIFLK